MNLTQITSFGGDLEKLTCLVVVTFAGGGVEMGTGLLLDNTHVLTAQHMVNTGVAITSITIYPAYDQSASTHPSLTGDTSTGAIHLYAGYSPTAPDPRTNAELDLAILTISGTGAGLPASAFVGLSAFYSDAAAAGWNVTERGFPTDGLQDFRIDIDVNGDGVINPADGGPDDVNPLAGEVGDGVDDDGPASAGLVRDGMYRTSGGTSAFDLSFGHDFFRINGSTQRQGQSGAAVIANIDNDAAEHTGADLGESFILGVASNRILSTGESLGAYFNAARLDWVMDILQAGGGNVSQMPFNYLFGSDQGDTIEGTYRRDNARGNAGVDTIRGAGGDDVLKGEDGNDTLSGDDGADTLDGGAGTDTASYASATAGVTVNLAAPAGNTGVAAGDTYVSIENITGSAHDDTLTGDAGDNNIDGGAGVDTLSGGAGNDELHGGLGNDILLFTNGEGGTFDGGDGNDTLRGTASGDVIGPGAIRLSIETITGDAGNDTIYGGSGVETIFGGAGSDVILASAGGGSLSLFGKDGVATGGTPSDGDEDIFVTGGGVTFINDADGDDGVSVAGLQVFGGVQQSWMEGGVAAWSPFGSLFGVLPLPTANLMFAMLSAFIDTPAASFLSFGLTESNQLIVSIAGGRAGAIVIEGYDLDLETGAASGNVVAFQQVRTDSASIDSITAYLNLALRAGFGSCILGVDPLVIDLDRDGIELTGSARTYFDLDGDGFAERSVWTRGGDGFLVRDINSNGQIDNITEMFGDADTPGFTALAALDSNSDGKITAADAAFASLRVWVDADGDGVTDSGELHTLSELNIVEIAATGTSPDSATIRGNTIRADATVTFADSSTTTIADVMLNSNPADTRWLGDATISSAAAALPALRGFGTNVDLRIQMSDDATLLTQVDDFAALAASTSWADLRAAVEDILFRWAEVDGVTATPVGADFDLQRLAFLEQWFGAELAPRDGLGNPVILSTAELVSAWESVLDAATVRLAAQGPLAAIFADVSYNVTTDRLEAATPTVLADAMTAIMAELPSGGSEALAAWSDNWAPMLNAFADALTRSDHNLIRTDFVVMSLIQAVEASTQPLSLTQLVAGLELEHVVIGGAGADTLTRSGTGMVVFVGGAGNDTMTGSAGQSVYVFGANFGQDTIIDVDGGEMGDRLRFASHALSDLTFARSGNDLVISVIGASDQVTVRDHFLSNPMVADYGIEEIQFADGTYLDVRAIAEIVGRGTAAGETLTGTAQEDQLEGMGGNDTLLGGDGGDTYYFSAGDGQDTIQDLQTTPLYQSADIAVMEDGINFEDIILSRDGASDDLLITFAGSSDSILVVDQFDYGPLGIRGGTLPEGFIGTLLGGPFTGNGQLATDSRIEAILFHSGGALSWQEIQARLIDIYTTDDDDITYGFGTSDVFHASAGNDVLVGFDGGDAYEFDRDAGQDTIHDQTQFLTLLGTDAVIFAADIALADVTFSRVQGTADLLITIDGSDATLTIVDQFDGRMMDLLGLFGVQWFDRVETFTFADGTLDWEDVLAIVTTGGAGDDHLVGDFYRDTMNGGAGNDYLDGGDEGDTYVFGLGDGQDTIEDTPGYVINQTPDRLSFEAGIDVGDVVFSRDGETDDLIVSIVGTTDQIRIVGQYDVSETGPFGAIAFNAIEEFHWSDNTTILWRDLIQDIIDASATSGDDLIIGSHYNDVIDGGAGNDELRGGNGSDTYVFNLGGGADIVQDFADNILADNTDVLAFGAGIAVGDIILERNGADVTLHIAGTSDEITIEGQFDYTTINVRFNEIEQISFTGGPVWTAADLRANVLLQASTSGNDTIEGFWSDDTMNGGAGDDMLRGGDGDDLYVFSAGFGDDTIEEAVINAGYDDFDAISFASGYDSTDAIFSRSGDDLIISFSGSGDSVTVVGQFDHIAYFSGWTDIEQITFGDSVVMTDLEIRQRLLADARTSGADTISGFYTADVLDGGAGNDTLVGYGGGDTYLFGLGGGQDVIQESYATVYEDRPDIVVFGAGIARADVTFARVGDDLVASIAGATDTLTIDNHFLPNGQGRVELFRFADGTTITAAQAEANALASLSTPGADTINGTTGADLIDGGAGNDTLRGATGSDTYVFGRGYGQDLIEENGGSSGSPQDRVVFGEGVALGDLVFSRSGDDLIIQIAGTSDQLTIDNQFYGAVSTGVDSRYRVDTFEFADGRILSAVEVDALTLAAHQTSGADTILAFDTDDVLDGGAGADFMRGGGGNDTYRFGVGYGADTIEETNETHGDLDDAVVFAPGITADDLVLSRSGDHAVITISGTSDSLTLQYQFRSSDSEDVYGSDRIERFVFADGTVWTATDLENFTLAAQQTPGADTIVGYDRTDVLDGGAGNDTMQGNGGDDTYLFGRGYGQDSILETSETYGSLADTIRFGADIAPEDIQLSRSGYDLVIHIAGTSDTLTVRYQFLSADSSDVDGNDRVENFVFADGTVWSAVNVELMTLAQSHTSGADTITGYDTPDVIDGGAGNDTLQGNGGSDIYIFGRGYGHDVVNETTETFGSLGDTLSFAAGVAPGDVAFSRDDHDLIISILGTDDQIRINLQLWSSDSADLYGHNRIENFVFSDGTTLTAAEIDVRLLAQESSATADTIEGFDSADRIEGLGGDDTLSGDAGDDELIGGSGDDLLVGGAGADVLDGGAGNDSVSYSTYLSGATIDLATSSNNAGAAAGDVFLGVENVIGTTAADTITGDGNANRLDGNDGADTLNGGDGDDTLIGGKLGDALNGGSGSDTASYITSTGAVVANLANAASNTGQASGDTYSSIENLTGTNFADTLTGDANANVLDGGSSNDTLIGAAGADTLNGNSGTDIASYTNAAAAVMASLANSASNTGDAAGDVYVSIESLTGSAYADTLTGDSAANTLDGGNGDDLLIGGAGADVLNGNSGTDTASYAAAAAAITVSLATTSGSTGDAQGDSFTAVENLIGTAYADSITGSSGANQLDGGAGDDTLIGAAGADALIGGDGVDTASYTGGAVTASLASPGGNTGDAAGDTYSGVENLSGTSSADTLTGDGNANTLTGNGGNDTLNGGDGDDFLYGGGNSDAMTGGNGSDTVVYTTASSLTINLANSASNAGSEASGDTYTTIENVITAGGNDTITGTSGANRLNGAAGNDTLIGGAGADELIGDTGADTASYSTAAAGVTANLITPANNAGDASGDTFSSIENLIGSGFADTLAGDSGVNTLDGGNGDDVLIGGAGADVLTGGSGTDTASYATAAAGVLANLASAGSNTGDASGDSYSAIENLTGSSYADTLVGSSSANTISGGGGADTITGAAGLDTLYGDAGADTFVYNATSESAVGANADRIMDFSQGSDIINLTAIDANSGVSGNQAFSFIGASAFSNVAGQLRAVVSGSDIYIYGDVNGDGTADFQIILASTSVTLAATDFGL